MQVMRRSLTNLDPVNYVSEIYIYWLSCSRVLPLKLSNNIRSLNRKSCINDARLHFLNHLQLPKDAF